MLRSWRIGSAFGIGIYIHATFWLLPLIVVVRSWSYGGLGFMGLWLAVLAGAMGCVVLHELGHALMARHFGIRTRDITLYPIGGVARLERLSERPGEELLIALAGPAVNVVIVALLLPLAVLTSPGLGLLGTEGTPLAIFVGALLGTNILLVLFNMIPAFPMDGGRVLRALLQMSLGRLRATEIAAKLGIVIAGFMAASFFFLRDVPYISDYVSNPMLVLVALFIAFVGQQELALVRHQEAMRRAQQEQQAQVISAQPVFYGITGEPVQPGFSGFQWDARLRAWVQWRDGQPVATYGAGPE